MYCSRFNGYEKYKSQNCWYVFVPLEFNHWLWPVEMKQYFSFGATIIDRIINFVSWSIGKSFPIITKQKAPPFLLVTCVRFSRTCCINNLKQIRHDCLLFPNRGLLFVMILEWREVAARWRGEEEGGKEARRKQGRREIIKWKMNI